MIVSDDATIWSITNDRHYDNRNSSIIQATGFNRDEVITHKGAGLEDQPSISCARRTGSSSERLEQLEVTMSGNSSSLNENKLECLNFITR